MTLMQFRAACDQLILSDICSLTNSFSENGRRRGEGKWVFEQRDPRRYWTI